MSKLSMSYQHFFGAACQGSMLFRIYNLIPIPLTGYVSVFNLTFIKTTHWLFWKYYACQKSIFWQQNRFDQVPGCAQVSVAGPGPSSSAMSCALYCLGLKSYLKLKVKKAWCIIKRLKGVRTGTELELALFLPNHTPPNQGTWLTRPDPTPQIYGTLYMYRVQF